MQKHKVKSGVKLILNQLIKSEAGNTLVIMAIVLLVLVAISGMVVDTGLLIEGKIKLHSATKAAAKSVVEAYDAEKWESERSVVLNPEVAEQTALIYLQYNLPEATIVSVVVPEESPNKAIVKTKLKVNFVFMKIFGVENCEVGSTITGIVG